MSRTRTPTPSELVFQHVTSNTALARKAKRVLESQLDAMARELSLPDVPPKRRNEIILACAEIFRILDVSIQSGSKLLVSPVRGAGHEPKEDTPDVESIIHELTKGRTSRGSKP
jgi:hypothetical protein